MVLFFYLGALYVFTTAQPFQLPFNSPQLFREAGWPCVKVSFWDIAGTANMSNESIGAMAPEIDFYG